MNSFEESLAKTLDTPCVCAVLLLAMAEGSKDPKDLEILEVVGYCKSQKAAKAYCDRENEVFQPAKGGVNPFTYVILGELT